MTTEEIAALEAAKLKLVEAEGLESIIPAVTPDPVTENDILGIIETLAIRRGGLADSTLQTAINTANATYLTAITTAITTSKTTAQTAINAQTGTDITA